MDIIEASKDHSATAESHGLMSFLPAQGVCCRRKHINHQISKSMCLTECSMPQKSKVTKNYLLFASNRLERSANCAFSPATPIDHTYQCRVLLRMLDLKMGNGRQVIKSVSTSKHGDEAMHCSLPSAHAQS